MVKRGCHLLHEVSRGTGARRRVKMRGLNNNKSLMSFFSSWPLYLNTKYKRIYICTRNHHFGAWYFYAVSSFIDNFK